jgi:hypothetical protein
VLYQAAEGVESITEQHDREVAARALREAAALERGADANGVHSVPASWLREMADRVEAGG